MALEPGHVLLMESPGLLLQFASSQVLLVGSLGIVKDEKQTVRSKLFKYLRIVEYRRRRGRVTCWRWIGILRCVTARALVLRRTGHGSKRFTQCRQVRRAIRGCSTVVGVVVRQINATTGSTASQGQASEKQVQSWDSSRSARRMIRLREQLLLFGRHSLLLSWLRGGLRLLLLLGLLLRLLAFESLLLLLLAQRFLLLLLKLQSFLLRGSFLPLLLLSQCLLLLLLLSQLRFLLLPLLLRCELLRSELLLLLLLTQLLRLLPLLFLLFRFSFQNLSHTGSRSWCRCSDRSSCRDSCGCRPGP
mmetsp:Transcript_76958/g.115798  ORF Transcript_76958/g.115798 Transcript_76958/m.115798 type:complete len:303 (-) Transcript_76958:715-1623(-)